MENIFQLLVHNFTFFFEAALLILLERLPVFKILSQNNNNSVEVDQP